MSESSSPRKGWVFVGLALLLLGLAFEGLRPAADLDVWWQIRLGEVMVQTRSLVPSDVFSYTRMETPWPWKDWGTALLLYAVHAAGGIAGLVLFKAALLLASAAVLWRSLRIRSIPPALALLSAAICMSAASFRYSERGATVSLLIVVVVVWLIDRHRNGKRGLVWIIPLAIFNANVHRGVLLLPVIVGAFAIVEVVESLVLQRDREWKRSALIAMGTALACLATPFGHRIITTTITLMGQHSPLITEWAPVEYPLVSRLSPASLGAIAFVSIGGVLGAIKRRDLWDLALIALALGLGLQSIRHLPYVALIGAGPAAAGWAVLGESAWRGRLQALIGITSGALALVYTTTRPLPSPSLGLAPAHHPEQGVRFVQEQGLHGRVFNEFGYGGFLLFHLWPEHRVYIDGRTDLVYTPQSVEQYIACVHDPNAFAKEQATWNFQWVLVDNSPMQGTFAHLDRNPQWVLVHASRRALIYVKRGGLNDALIETHGYQWLWPHALEASVIRASQAGHGHEARAELARMQSEDPQNVYASMAAEHLEQMRAR